MEVECQSWDRISTLPQDIIEKILSLMPIEDALRTSIVSKKWRYFWTGKPKLCICIADTNSVNEIDQIIVHLSLIKNIKKFIIEIAYMDEYYNLPCSFFSLQRLEHLSLKYCKFELPLIFNGFSMLKSLVFEDVTITANLLQQLLTSCPLLEEFTLNGIYQIHFIGGSKCTELFKCLPSDQVVNISWRYIEMVCYNYQNFTTLLDPQDYLDLKLDHLKELEITCFHNYAPEMEFVKLIMAKSPLLKKARIELSTSVSADKEVTMITDLLSLSSPEGKLIIQRPNKLPTIM